MSDIKNKFPCRSLTELITHPISNSNEREINEHLYNRFFPESNIDQMRCKPLDNFLEKLNILLSKYDDRAFSIKAGGKAWERFYKEEVAEAEKAAETEKAFQPLNSDIFIFCDNNLINKIFGEINELLEEFNTYLNTLNRDIINIVRNNNIDKKILFKIEKVSLDKIDDIPIKTILFPCRSFRVIYDYWLNDNIIFNGHILYVSFFPVRSPNFNDFKNKFIDNYIRSNENENFLNNEGLHFFGNKIDGNRSLEKGMNIDEIRMKYLMNYYESAGQLPKFHKIYNEVFFGTDLYCIYDEIKLNNLYYSEIVDPIKNEIKKEFVKCFRNYCYYILQDLDKAFKNDKYITDHISMLVGGESMSFYNITNIEDTDDYDIKVFYEGKKENAIEIIYNNLSKYVVLLNNIFPVANIIQKNNRVNLDDEERSLARLRFIKNICKDYDLFSIDFKIIVKINNQDINNIAIDIPILDVAIVKKNIKNFKNTFTQIAKKYGINTVEDNTVEDNCIKSVIINITTKKRQSHSTNYNEEQNKRRRKVGGGVGDIPEKKIEQIEEDFINSQDNLLPEEPATQAAQEANTADYAAAQATEAAVKEDINTTWNINIPTLLYYIYDYCYMYGKIENKKMRFLAGKTDKDKARYSKIKSLLFNDEFYNKKINRDILYDDYFNKFLNYNINNIQSDIDSYINDFKNMMLTESYKPKIKMPFKKKQDHMMIGGCENSKYSYFLADLFQNILDSIFFYHKSF